MDMPMFVLLDIGNEDEMLDEEGVDATEWDESTARQDKLTFEDVLVPVDVEIHDISDELSRTYVYDAYDLNLEEPVALRINDNGSHYVVLANGTTVYVKPGWRYLRWVPRKGFYNITF